MLTWPSPSAASDDSAAASVSLSESSLRLWWASDGETDCVRDMSENNCNTGQTWTVELGYDYCALLSWLLQGQTSSKNCVHYLDCRDRIDIQNDCENILYFLILYLTRTIKFYAILIAYFNVYLIAIYKPCWESALQYLVSSWERLTWHVDEIAPCPRPHERQILVVLVLIAAFQMCVTHCHLANIVNCPSIVIIEAAFCITFVSESHHMLTTWRSNYNWAATILHTPSKASMH